MTGSFASGSTIPFTPEHFADDADGNDNNAFALLRPITENACNAFDATVNAAIENTPKFDHFRKFLHIGERKVKRAVSVYTEDGDEEATEPELWTGEFKFSLDASPNDPQSWWLGSKCLPGEIDVLLAPGDRYKELRIAQKHARLFLHPESYRLVLEAQHSVVIGRVCTEMRTLTKMKQQILEDGDMIIIGPYCTYSFQYTEFFQTSLFAESLSQFRKTHFGHGALNRHLTPSSVGTPMQLGNYFCSPAAFAKGTFGAVSVGWTREGTAVAIKRFKTPKEREISSHKRLMEHIQGHDNILQLLECVSHFATPAPDAYCVYAPLATVVLREVIPTRQVDINTRVALLSDYLCGLSYLHEQKNVMHLDISPGNLAITSLENPKGIIIDLDAAVESVPCFDHGKGTLPYLAPEIVDLKYERTDKPFERSVDIWALGLCMFDLCQSEFLLWTRLHPQETRQQRSLQQDNTVSNDRYLRFQRKMDEMKTSAETSSHTQLFTWIEAMTKFEVADRHTASQLYAKVSVISKVLDRERIIPQRATKRPREE